ncbi:hypothetical protein BN14_06749 [Rhizoctonia solani AG-1 IB]|uniref:Uncharacterized protein n=1 Tax=Thanatephorus cucumeris (strain AG1-IB / isolate 7/3/14) TaxID=1108050 RepID=M5BZL5_THACB|nr:hypothetical protein BN14_06749 [Rhizoctonia solani AG-1 IB]
MEVLNNPTLNKKHFGHGSLHFTDEKAMEIFMAKIKAEPMMFGTETVMFSLDKPAAHPSLALPHLHARKAALTSLQHQAGPTDM